MWVSYLPLQEAQRRLQHGAPLVFAGHRRIVAPRQQWESYRIGAGTVPVRVPEGWLTLYHGVEERANGERRYCTGVLILAADDVSRVVYRSARPILSPETPEECEGTVGHVVFPTALEERGNGFDLYYGMADTRCGVAHLRYVARRRAATERAA
jgi:predicted GH43/DUF377 family glycosyl hydrolase